MPTLLQINATANWGSTGKIAEAIGVSAIQSGWDSYIAYGRIANSSSSHLIKIGCTLSPYIHYIYDRCLDKEGLGSQYATLKLVKQIDAIRPDVVHLHNLHDHYLNYKILFEYLNQTNIKVVWTFHDCWAFTGHCYHFMHSKCMKWKSMCNCCAQKHRFIDRSGDNYLLKESLFTACENMTIIPCSEWMKDLVNKSFLKDKPTYVIHNGVDIQIFKVLHNVRKNDAKFQIVAVSNVWTRSKGLYDLYKLRELLDDGFEITIVGLTDGQIQQLPSGIIGISRTQNIEQLVRLYNEADVLVNPTYADTFPTVNIEALACGVPVITYKTGGSPEAVDERTGIVIDQGDVESLARAVIRLKINPLSREECRRRAEKYFDRSKCFYKYIELYEKILRK